MRQLRKGGSTLVAALADLNCYYLSGHLNVLYRTNHINHINHINPYAQYDMQITAWPPAAPVTRARPAPA